MSLNKKIILVISFALITSIFVMLIIIYPIVDLYCVPYLIQNVLLPFFATRLLLADLQERFQSSPRKTGALIGAGAGFLPSTAMITCMIMLIYINGGERTTPNSKIAFGIVAASMVALWVGLLILSSFIGFIATIRRRK